MTDARQWRVQPISMIKLSVSVMGSEPISWNGLILISSFPARHKPSFMLPIPSELMLSKRHEPSCKGFAIQLPPTQSELPRVHGYLNRLSLADLLELHHAQSVALVR